MKPADYVADRLMRQDQLDAGHGLRSCRIELGDPALGDGRDRQGGMKQRWAGIVSSEDRCAAHLVVSINPRNIGKCHVGHG